MHLFGSCDRFYETSCTALMLHDVGNTPKSLFRIPDLRTEVRNYNLPSTKQEYEYNNQPTVWCFPSIILLIAYFTAGFSIPRFLVFSV
jgi:hypothetical protein